MMKFTKNLFGSGTAKQPVPPTAAAEPIQAKSAYLTQTVIFGMHLYRHAGEDSSVYFVDESRGIRKLLVDTNGNIQNFPGIIQEDFWMKAINPHCLKPQVSFRSEFVSYGNRWLFRWQIQPDGAYWEDEDRFGGTNDREVILYTLVDQDGNFTAPFRIYKLGHIGYTLDRFRLYHADSMNRMMKAITDGEDHMGCPYDMFPQLLGVEINHISDRFFQLRNKDEAIAYWSDPVLSSGLMALAQAMLDSPKSMHSMAGWDSGRVKGCMTLFCLLTQEPLFQQILDKFFDGKMEAFTQQKLTEL